MEDVRFCSGDSASHACIAKTTATLQLIRKGVTQDGPRLPSDHPVEHMWCQSCFVCIHLGTPYLLRVKIWDAYQP